MRRWIAVLAVAVTVAVAVTACSNDPGSDMTPSAVSRLDVVVADVRSSVEAGDDEAARAHLTSLRMTVADLLVSNAITADRALVINQAIERVEHELAARAVAATTTSVAPTSTTRPAPTTTTSTTSTTEARRGNGKDKDDDDD
jgi:hypothetical protein